MQPEAELSMNDEALMDDILGVSGRPAPTVTPLAHSLTHMPRLASSLAHSLTHMPRLAASLVLLPLSFRSSAALPQDLDEELFSE